MAGPHAGELKWLVQFRRAVTGDDGISEVQTWEDLGQPQRARKLDASDSERWQASEVGSSITTRFVLRRSGLSEIVAPKDRLICEGVLHEITGKRELAGNRRWLEISTVARTDRT
ncbi:head-tail adaptor protein [Ponticoccus litoralis]|uniref:Head-tail adaptor protein n=1 Tax=Ponticoccus litoralis TaxID=422297 RepID=A0AAW9SFK8_9RHOB